MAALMGARKGGWRDDWLADSTVDLMDARKVVATAASMGKIMAGQMVALMVALKAGLMVVVRDARLVVMKAEKMGETMAESRDGQRDEPKVASMGA